MCEGGSALKPADIRENKLLPGGRETAGGRQHLGQESNVKPYNFISEADLSERTACQTPSRPQKREGGGGGEIFRVGRGAAAGQQGSAVIRPRGGKL